MTTALAIAQPDERTETEIAGTLAGSPFAELFAPYVEGQAVEWVLVAAMDERGCLVRFVGIDDRADMNRHVIACIRAALRPHRVCGIVMAHNHPDGPALPSAGDIATTRRIATLCRLADAHLIDHLIFAPNAVISLRALGHLH